jgi:hypothetical protein
MGQGILPSSAVERISDNIWKSLDTMPGIQWCPTTRSWNDFPKAVLIGRWQQVDY